MGKGVSYYMKKTLRLRQEMSIGFYLTDFLFRKILRQNADTRWAIHHTSTLHCPANIRRGKEVYPGDSPGVYIDAFNGVEIGDYTNLGPNVGLISSNHDFVNNDVYTRHPPIVIGAYCWFGKGATVLPGVRLGDFTIVGAGAIVTKSFEQGYCVIAGNPASVIKELNRTACEAFAQSKQ